MQEGPWTKYAQLRANGSETPAALEGPWTKYAKASTSAVDPNDAIRQQQANYQSPVYPQGESSRTAPQVMQDQAANVLRGIPQAVTGIPKAIGAVGGALFDAVTGRGSGRGQELVKGAALGMAAPFTPAVKSMVPGVAMSEGMPESVVRASQQQVPLPESPEWTEAAQGAGAMLGAAELPNAASGAILGAKGAVRGALRQVTTPQAMDARAAANKAVALKPTTLENQAAAQTISPELSRRHMGTGIRGTTIDRNLMKDNQNAGTWVRAAEQRLIESARPEHQVAKAEMLKEVQQAYNALDPDLFPAARSALKRAASSINRQPEFIPAKGLIELRRNLDQVAEEMGVFRETGVAADKIAAKTFRGVADMVRKRANNLDDSLRLANHEYWLTRKAVDVIGRRELGEVGKVGISLPGRGTLLDDLVAMGIGGSVGGPAGAIAAEGLNLARQSRGFANVKSGLQQRVADFIRQPKPPPAGLLSEGVRQMPAPNPSGITVETGPPLRPRSYDDLFPATRQTRTDELLERVKRAKAKSKQ